VPVSDAELQAIQIEGCAFHDEWNYVIRPHDLS
jgi:hypothetical protein